MLALKSAGQGFSKSLSHALRLYSITPLESVVSQCFYAHAAAHVIGVFRSVY